MTVMVHLNFTAVCGSSGLVNIVSSVYELDSLPPDMGIGAPFCYVVDEDGDQITYHSWYREKFVTEAGKVTERILLIPEDAWKAYRKQ